MKKEHLHFPLWCTLIYMLMSCSPKESQFINTLEQENLKGDIESIVLKTFDNQSNNLTYTKTYKYSEDGFIQEMQAEDYRFEYDKHGKISLESYDGEAGSEKKYKITNNTSETDYDSFHYNDKGLINYYISSGKDTAEYIYNQNNRLIKKIHRKINLGEIQLDNYIYNDNGDISQINTEVTDLNNGFLASYPLIAYNGYQYDDNNNWIARRVSQIINPRTPYASSKSHTERREIKYRVENNPVSNNNNEDIQDKDNTKDTYSQKANSTINIHTEAQSVFVVNQNNVRFQEVQNVKGDVGIGKNYNYWLTDKIRVPQGKRWTLKKALCVRNQNGSKFSTNISLVHLIDGSSGGHRKEYDLTNERHNITLVGGDIFILKAFNAHAEYTISMDVEFEETNEY